MDAFCCPNKDSPANRAKSGARPDLLMIGITFLEGLEFPQDA